MAEHEVKSSVALPLEAKVASPGRNAVPKRAPDPVMRGIDTVLAPLAKSALPTSQVAAPFAV